MSQTSSPTTKLQPDNVVKIGAGTYRGYHARIRKVFARMVDVALIKDAQQILLQRPVYVTLSLPDVQLEIISQARRQ